MKIYRKIPEPVTQCIEFRCDMCNRKAERPENNPPVAAFEIPGGFGGGELGLTEAFKVGRVEAWDHKDLCPGCTKWMMENLEAINNLRRSNAVH